MDARARGPVWALLAPHAFEPREDALALRMMGAVNRLVLEGSAPGLARFYPSVGGGAGPASAWGAFGDLLLERGEQLRPLVGRPCQTNEVGRSAALLGGFLSVARETGLPLRVLEIGASAGLNLRWDRYFYGIWGTPTSPLRLGGHYRTKPPAWPALVSERRGCDLVPLDPTSRHDELTLRSFIWPDMLSRLALMDAAIGVARGVTVEIDQADAGDWLEAQLAEARAGLATVVFQSVVAQYLGEEGRRRAGAAIQEAALRASAQAPLAWLRMEPGKEEMEVRLSLWPGPGQDRLPALTSAHGHDTRWVAWSGLVV